MSSPPPPAPAASPPRTLAAPSPASPPRLDLGATAATESVGAHFFSSPGDARDAAFVYRRDATARAATDTEGAAHAPPSPPPPAAADADAHMRTPVTRLPPLPRAGAAAHRVARAARAAAAAPVIDTTTDEGTADENDDDDDEGSTDEEDDDDDDDDDSASSGTGDVVRGGGGGGAPSTPPGRSVHSNRATVLRGRRRTLGFISDTDIEEDDEDDDDDDDDEAGGGGDSPRDSVDEEMEARSGPSSTEEDEADERGNLAGFVTAPGEGVEFEARRPPPRSASPPRERLRDRKRLRRARDTYLDAVDPETGATNAAAAAAVLAEDEAGAERRLDRARSAVAARMAVLRVLRAAREGGDETAPRTGPYLTPGAAADLSILAMMPWLATSHLLLLQAIVVLVSEGDPGAATAAAGAAAASIVSTALSTRDDAITLLKAAAAAAAREAEDFGPPAGPAHPRIVTAVAAEGVSTGSILGAPAAAGDAALFGAGAVPDDGADI